MSDYGEPLVAVGPLVGLIGLVYLPFWLLLLFEAASKRLFGWFVAILFLPIFGPVFYFAVVRPDREFQRRREQARALREQEHERESARQREELSELRREVAALRAASR